MDPAKKERMLAREAAFRRRINCTFVTLFFLNFIRVFDNGILPALTTYLKEESDLTDFQVGSLGSLTYMGEVTGKLE